MTHSDSNNLLVLFNAVLPQQSKICCPPQFCSQNPFFLSKWNKRMALIKPCIDSQQIVAKMNLENQQR
ncbi:hypothetical protein CW745_03310 [Psychromonas sp. psych-6C06]|nr:hypothetical protein CW745_03310 [Psychromonas sp. psych-6C06]